MIEQLMQRLAQAGATAIIKIDHERFAEQGEPWTIVISGRSSAMMASFGRRK